MKYALRTLAAAAATTILLGASGAAAFMPAEPANTKTSSDVTLVATQKMPAKQFWRTKVRLRTDEPTGTIIVDTNNKYLYYIEGPNKATRYGIGVGREGFGWSGVVKVQRKAEWPGWTPPKEMIARERKKGHILPAYQEGGIDNPLGARALYLYKGRNDSGFRIHGTNQPWTIGLNMSSGCIRMMNKDVEHLYDRASIGAKVIVIGPGNKQGDVSFDVRGVDILRTIFGG
ncbi:MAG TPA: L,D-transpeptidase [Pararhizobium sp.]|uniref:L,D-transpeptidase n=1 Tax=Pararhizobium sp. TaxID=1977563 RepID=UPI002CB96C1C|nr:L,D-transpeptidase [Pararhizobium sp.]HTO34084.1 L,D-transpeptidase [Pararhizobium sp.]